jgi:hypothetical protein
MIRNNSFPGPSVIAHICSVQEVTLGRSWFKANPGKKVTLLKKQTGMVIHVCNPSYKGGLWVQADSGKSARSYLKDSTKNGHGGLK